MSEAARAAPYASDTRAKGWRFEIDYEKVEQSDTWALAAEVPMAQHALLMMWLVAWTQAPCGSMPNDEALIRAKCRIAPKAWASLREILMRGWWLADDGRLYHDTIVARVAEMLEYRRKTAERVAKHKLAMREQRGGNALATGEDDVRNDTGTGTGTNVEKKPSASSAGPTVPCPYQSIVDRYHAALPTLPSVKVIGTARQRAMRKWWAWVLTSTKSDGERRATNAEEALAWISGYFERAALNDFLMGRTARGSEHADWQCDIDFLMTEKGIRQVIEKTRIAA